jgi:hypothetical protein
MNREALKRISGHVEKLSEQTNKRGLRLMHWRLIIRIAQDAYDQELHELESLSAVYADPALTAAHGEPTV